MNQISWIGREAKHAESPACVSLCEALTRSGYPVQGFTAVEAGEVNPEWISNKIPPSTRFIFLSDPDLNWVKEVTQKIHEAKLPDRPCMTVCWIYETFQGELLPALLGSGVDEVISVSETPSSLVTRLHLRSGQTDERLSLQSKMKVQNLKEAKNETILKQREEFLSVCAHDLRSPLGLIQSSLSMILNGGAPEKFSELHTELLSRAKRQAGQAITLVNDLLDVMSYEQGLKPQYQLINLDQLLTEFFKDYSFQADQKKIRFHYENPVRPWRILADSDRIRQLLQNLFVNALKFTQSNKNIYLSVMPFQGRRKTDPPFPMLIISLKDEGRGIPQNELQKIFDRFTQVKDYSRSEGRGLGLTVAKQISTLHDGNIWVQSVEGEGSTFFVLFPHVVSRTYSEGEASAKKIKTVLVVEPSEVNRERYFALMGRWGYEVIYAKDGIDALTKAFYCLPNVVMFTENVPKMPEIEAANILKSDPLTARIPCLLVTDAASLNVPKKKNDLPFDQTLKLPVTRESFQIALDSATKTNSTKFKKAA